MARPTQDLQRWLRTLQPIPWRMHGFRAANDLRKRAWTPVLPALAALWQARGRDAARHVRRATLRALGERLGRAALPDVTDLHAGRLALTGLEVAFPPKDWRLPGATPLQVYEAHYLDWADVLAAAITQENAGETRLQRLLEVALREWTEAAPHIDKAWEPYPRARRTLSCLRAAGRLEALAWHGRDRLQDAHLGLRDRLLGIAAAAATDLGLLLERHLGGNHLLVDRIALAAAEVAWGSGEAKLEAALTEAEGQFPGDGAHVEASPMYHALLCEDLLVLRGLMATPGPQAARLDAVLDRALGWLAAVRHPDGSVPAFGDSDPQVLDSLPLVRTTLHRPGRTDPAQSVWTSRHGGHLAIVHTAPPVHVAQPGHAHADHLSVEWSWRDQRVLADAGLAGYEGDPHRELNRSAASHSTVEVPGVPSIELWASFRVGARGRILGLEQGHTEGWDWLAAAHAWPGDTHRHLRLVAQHAQGRLVIADALLTRHAVREGLGRLLLAPSVTAQSMAVQSVTAQSATAQSATAQSATAQSATAQGVAGQGAAELRVGVEALAVASTVPLQVASGMRFSSRGLVETGQEVRYPVGPEAAWTLLGGTALDLVLARAPLQGRWDELAARIALS